MARLTGESDAGATLGEQVLLPPTRLHPPDTTCLHPSGAALGGKTPFKLPAEQRQTRLPEETLCGAGGGTITASLNSGEGAPWAGTVRVTVSPGGAAAGHHGLLRLDRKA